MNNRTRIVPLVLLCLSVGCKSAEERAAERAAQEAKMRAALHEGVPEDSPLRKVELGMNETEVQAVLGPPTRTSTRQTGKGYNPFNFSGRDTIRVVYHWQGIGRVEFSHGSWGQRNGAIACAANPDEQ